MGTDGAGKEAARRKAAAEAKYPGSAPQASRGRAKNSQEQKPGLRTATLTTKNTPLSGRISTDGAYIVKLAQDPRKTQIIRWERSERCRPRLRQWKDTHSSYIPVLFQLFFPNMFRTPVLLDAKQGFFYGLKAPDSGAFSVICVCLHLEIQALLCAGNRLRVQSRQLAELKNDYLQMLILI